MKKDHGCGPTLKTWRGQNANADGGKDPSLSPIMDRWSHWPVVVKILSTKETLKYNDPYEAAIGLRTGLDTVYACIGRKIRALEVPHLGGWVTVRHDLATGDHLIEQGLAHSTSEPDYVD